MTSLTILILLFDTLLGTLLFVAMAALIKAWSEREEPVTLTEAEVDSVPLQAVESKA